MNDSDPRWTEIKQIWLDNPGLYLLVGFLIGIAVAGAFNYWITDISGLLASLAPEVFGMSITVLVIDRLYSRRDQHRQKTDQQSRLLRDMSSSIEIISRRALDEIRYWKWGNADDSILAGQDFRGVNLSNLDLSGFNFSHCNLYSSKLNGSGLQGTVLDGANLTIADLRNANLTHASLKGILAAPADFSEATFYGAILMDANLANANLRGANLTRADLRDANLASANLRGANLLEAKLEGCVLDGASFDDSTIMPNGLMWSVNNGSGL